MLFDLLIKKWRWWYKSSDFEGF